MKTALRILCWTLSVLAALAGLALLGYWLWCDLWTPLELFQLVWLLLAIPCAACACLFHFARRRIRAGRRGGRAMAGAALAGGVLAVAFFGYYLWIAGPWYNGIVLSGTAPDGGAYFLSLAWNDWFDGYDLRLFHRQADGQWRSLWGGYNWDPEARGCEVLWDVRAPVIPNSPVIRLADGTERYFHDRKQTVHPASLSPDDLHALHLAEMRNNRSLLCLWKARKGGAE